MWSVKAKGSLTARPTSRAEAKAGLSDPTVPRGRAVAQRIKVTLGIDMLSHLKETSELYQFLGELQEKLMPTCIKTDEAWKFSRFYLFREKLSYNNIWLL